MSNSARIATLNARLTKIQAAIDGTLDRKAASYSTEIQSLTSLSLAELQRMEQSVLSELERLNRGGRFGKIGFTKAT